MNKSESIKEIAKALCEFHKVVGKIKKEAKNPFFKSNYASLPNILDSIQEPLSDCSLSFVQFPLGENELSTTLMHTSGEWMEASYKVKPVKSDPQALGSAITYQRRYALCAILGLNTDDDDGNGASKPATIKEALAEVINTKDTIATWRKHPQFHKDQSFINACGDRKKQLADGKN